MTLDPLIGRQLANFRIDRVLGRGGMGQVYAGYDVRLERPVAVKVIDTRHRHDSGYAQRFIREARAIAAWRHESIIQIYYADDSDGLYYFAMEYIDGADLGALLRERATEQLPHAEVLRIGRAIASALDYAHQKGVIHRDLKPANVMIANDGRVILMDFGLALNMEQGSVGEVFGSAHYIAPEQARRSADAVPQSDLYALGVMLYEMLTGRVPFDDPSATSVALQHLTLPPPAPRTINPALGEAVEAVLLQALAKTPAERFQTGAALIEALGQALTGAPPPRQALVNSENLVGQQLDGYRLEAMLGRGGMAHIYRGRDVRLNRTVAIKVIDTPFRQDSAYVARFEREAQAIAHLEHPNIVRLYQYGDAHGLLYMAMEFIEGITLKELIDQRRESQTPLKPVEAVDLIRTLGFALDYAHHKGVIHRDVKPANVLIDQHQRSVLADFGLALMTENGTVGEIFGSAHYIAPEQAISSANVVPQSDVYALGVIAYELFTGRLPFDHDDPLAIAMQHLADPPPSPRQFQPTISAELESVLLHVLEKDPTQRYPTGGAFVAALEHALGLPHQPAPVFHSAPSKPLSPVTPVLELPSDPLPKAEFLAVQQPAPINPAVSAKSVTSTPPAEPSIHTATTTVMPTVSKPAAEPSIHAAATTVMPTVSKPAAEPSIHAAATTVMPTVEPAPDATAPKPKAPWMRDRRVIAGAIAVPLIFGAVMALRDDEQASAPISQSSPTTSVIAAPTQPPENSIPADLSGAVVLDDALGAASWYTQQESSGSMVYIDGKYHLSIPAGTNTFWSLAPSRLDLPTDNVAVSVNVEPRSGKGGILFGFQDLSDHYRLVTQPDGTYFLERRVGRSIETIATGSGAGTGRLTLVLRGTSARIYFGETLLGEATLPTTPQGRFGLILVTPDAGEVVFDTVTFRNAP